MEADLFESAAESNGVKLVVPDRPGIGRSDPDRDRTFESWAGDLLVLADSFGAEEFAVTGWSEGGPWALAAAAYLDPARLVHVSTIAGGCYGTFGANWAAPLLSAQDAVGGRLALHFRPGLTLMYCLLGVVATHFPRGYANAISRVAGGADLEVLADDAVMEIILSASRECFRQGARGLAADAQLIYAAWPFDITRVERAVHFWQGTDDTFVPAAINREIADRTPESVWHAVDGGGHFIAVSHATEILAAAANDLR